MSDGGISCGAARIMVVDDAIDNLNVITAILEREGLEVVGAPSADVALKLAARLEIDLAILDILMPGIDGLRLCRLLSERSGRRMPVIFISGREDAATVVDAFDAGGVDYITKPIQARDVIARVSCHLRLSRLQRELEARNQTLLELNRDLEEQMERRQRAEEELRCAGERLSLISAQEAARWGLTGFIGAASSWREICEEVRRLHAFARTHVLVIGESGCGKELVARAIHYGGARAEQPFIAVNCSAIPAELAESSFFGHVRGAFTGATSDRKGCFDLAHKGTLFLDEIAELPWALQAKLLRTLEDGTFTPVGATGERRVDVRIISATHANVEAKVSEGSFRQDLYFRLAQYTVRVPALRERPEDIPPLVSHFLQLFSKEMNLRSPEISADALDALLSHPFPGNVRELKNLAERALISSGGGPIERKHLQLTLRAPSPSSSPTPAVPQTLNLDQVKSQLIERALLLSHGNVTEAAKKLGVHRSWMYRQR